MFVAATQKTHAHLNKPIFKRGKPFLYLPEKTFNLLYFSEKNVLYLHQKNKFSR